MLCGSVELLAPVRYQKSKEIGTLHADARHNDLGDPSNGHCREKIASGGGVRSKSDSIGHRLSVVLDVCPRARTCTSTTRSEAFHAQQVDAQATTRDQQS